MSKDTVSVNLLVKTTAAMKKVDEWQAAINRVGANAKRMYTKVRSMTKSAVKNMSTYVQIFRGLMAAVGQTIDPMFDALLTGVVTAATALYQMGLAWNAAPGIGQIIFIALSAASIGLAIGQTASILAGRGHNKDRMAGIMSSISGMSSLLGGFDVA